MAKRPRGGMTAVSVGHGLNAIGCGVDDKTQTPVDDMGKGVIVEPRPMAGNESFDRLR